jgi:polysaccharide biosynthesis PFTS motif protein
MFHKAIGYRMFDRFTDKLTINIGLKTHSILGCSRLVVESRILQEFCALEMNNFISYIATHHKTINNKNEINIDFIRSDKFIYNINTGELSITNSYLIKKIIAFVLLWSSVLFLNIKSIFVSREQYKSYTLVYGVSIQDDTHSKFANFCKYGPIAPLRRNQHIIVERFSEANHSFDYNISYHKNPLHALLLNSKTSFLDFFSFLLSHFKNAFLYFKSIVDYPLMAILGSDFSYQAMAVSLNNKSFIKDIVITNSNLPRQLLWMSDLPNKKYILHMVWYSQNAPFAFTFKNDHIVSVEIEYRNIRVDETWVWTKYFANHLKSLGTTGIFHAVGPIMWYLPVQEVLPQKDCINISVFDVQPKSTELLDKIGYKNSYSYYSFENVSEFILDIIQVISIFEKKTNNRCRIMLKHKRASANDRYNGFIDNLCKNNKITMVNHKENIYSLISNSDIIISIPYTSTAYIADYMNIPSIFFDPVEELVPVYEEAKNITFVSGKDNLLSKLNDLFPSEYKV